MKASIFTALLLFSAVSANASNRIFGGENVVKTDPIAGMTVLLGDSGTCTGTLIDSDLVVTAAHCTNLTTVRFGLKEGESEARKSDGCARHPKYTGPKMTALRFDIALIKFSGGLPPGYRKSEVLTASKAPLAIGERAILAGYGRDDVGATGTLNKVDVTISHLDDYSPFEVVFDQTKGKGACYGDSGGPAWVVRNDKMFLIGVTNGPYDERDCNGHGVYQRVPSHFEWLAKAAKALRDSTTLFPGECLTDVQEPDVQNPIVAD